LAVSGDHLLVDAFGRLDLDVLVDREQVIHRSFLLVL